MHRTAGVNFHSAFIIPFLSVSSGTIFPQSTLPVCVSSADVQIGRFIYHKNFFVSNLTDSKGDTFLAFA